MTRYVLGFCFNRELDKVLLIKKDRPAWQFGKLNGVGGHIDSGETPRQAMQREFTEETGYAPYLSWTGFGCLYGEGTNGEKWEVWLFEAVSDSVVSMQNRHASEPVLLYSVASVLLGIGLEIPVIPNLRWIIPMARNHITGVDKTFAFSIHEATKEDLDEWPEGEGPFDTVYGEEEQCQES